LEKATNEWILFIDSDERICDKLKAEIINKLKNTNDINGFYFKRTDIFLGNTLKHGETSRVQLIRLGKKSKGMWQGRVHEKWKIGGRLGRMGNPIMHNSHMNLRSFLEKINIYSDIVAQSWIEEGRIIRKDETITYPLGKFLYNYFLKFGFLDGFAGLVIAICMSLHSFLARAKYLYRTNKI
jgi:hypothetical protein